MSEFRVPVQLSLAELGITSAKQDILRLMVWTLLHAEPVVTEHVHPTSKDVRLYSVFRKTGALLNPGPEDEPVHPLITEAVGRLYEAILPVTAAYFGADLRPLSTRYAARAHIHAPGDGDGEGHTDYYPSANVYANGQPGQGDLLIAKTSEPKTVEEIRQNAWRIPPIPETVVLFDGTVLPHFVEGIHDSERYARLSMNLTYWREQVAPQPFHPRHVDLAQIHE